MEEFEDFYVCAPEGDSKKENSIMIGSKQPPPKGGAL